MLAGEEPTSTYKGPKKYSIAKYVRERMMVYLTTV